MGKNGFASIIFILAILVASGAVVAGMLIYKSISSKTDVTNNLSVIEQTRDTADNLVFEGEITSITGKTSCKDYKGGHALEKYQISHYTPFVSDGAQRQYYCLIGDDVAGLDGNYSQIQGVLNDNKNKSSVAEPSYIQVKNIRKLVSVTADKSKYMKGDMANITITNFSQKTIWLALINIENDQKNIPLLELVKDYKWEELQVGKSTVKEVKIPVNENEFDTLFPLTVLLTVLFNYENPSLPPAGLEKTLAIYKSLEIK